jgi:glycosyltransferase involved in cell wall biosynthesis
MKISLNLVIYNEPKEIIKRCITSVQDLVDEMIFLVHENYLWGWLIAEFKPDLLLVRNLSDSVVEEWRNFLIDYSTGDWILVLDPDEYLDHEAQREISKFKAEWNPSSNIVGMIFRRKNYERTSTGNFAHMVNYPDPQLRFFKRGEVYWTGKVHEAPRLKDPSKILLMAKGHIIHDKLFETMLEWWRKFELYRSKAEP